MEKVETAEEVEQVELEQSWLRSGGAAGVCDDHRHGLRARGALREPGGPGKRRSRSKRRLRIQVLRLGAVYACILLFGSRSQMARSCCCSCRPSPELLAPSCCRCSIALNCSQLFLRFSIALNWFSIGFRLKSKCNVELDRRPENKQE